MIDESSFEEKVVNGLAAVRRHGQSSTKPSVQQLVQTNFANVDKYLQTGMGLAFELARLADAKPHPP
jgi:hypothetical protein